MCITTFKPGHVLLEKNAGEYENRLAACWTQIPLSRVVRDKTKDMSEKIVRKMVDELSKN